MSPTLRKRILFSDIDNIYDELFRCYDNAVNDENRKYTIGEALYTESKYYCNGSLLLDRDCQLMIKKYTYSKMTSTPPFPSVNVTPAELIDSFLIIEEECQQKPI